MLFKGQTVGPRLNKSMQIHVQPSRRGALAPAELSMQLPFSPLVVLDFWSTRLCKSSIKKNWICIYVA